MFLRDRGRPAVLECASGLPGCLTSTQGACPSLAITALASCRGRRQRRFLSTAGTRQCARALETGEADYIVKPFSPTEIVARIEAALRARARPETFVLEELAIDHGQRRVSVAGREIQHGHRVRAVARPVGPRETGREDGDATPAGVGAPGLGRHRSRAHGRQEAPGKARLRRGQPGLHLQRVRHRLPHREAGTGDVSWTCRLDRRPPAAVASTFGPCGPVRGVGRSSSTRAIGS